MDLHFMKKAFDLAQTAFDDGEIPVGAIVVNNDMIIGRGYNQVERLQDATAHAEMIAITSASEFLNSKYLKDCTFYVTLEPCLMCATAAKWAQVNRVVFGAYDVQEGFHSTNVSVFPKRVKIIPGVMEAECAGLVNDFFEKIRE